MISTEPDTSSPLIPCLVDLDLVSKTLSDDIVDRLVTILDENPAKDSAIGTRVIVELANHLRAMTLEGPITRLVTLVNTALRQHGITSGVLRERTDYMRLVAIEKPWLAVYALGPSRYLIKISHFGIADSEGPEYGDLVEYRKGVVSNLRYVISILREMPLVVIDLSIMVSSFNGSPWVLGLVLSTFLEDMVIVDHEGRETGTRTLSHEDFMAQVGVEPLYALPVVILLGSDLLSIGVLKYWFINTLKVCGRALVISGAMATDIRHITEIHRIPVGDLWYETRISRDYKISCSSDIVVVGESGLESVGYTFPNL